MMWSALQKLKKYALQIAAAIVFGVLVYYIAVHGNTDMIDDLPEISEGLE